MPSLAACWKCASDGKAFVELAKFERRHGLGRVEGGGEGRPRARHGKPETSSCRPRDCDRCRPAVAVFKYPVEFVVDVSGRAGDEGMGGEDRPASANGSTR